MPTTVIATMKAVRIHSFGGLNVLRYEEAPFPQPRARQVLVRVHAAGVNPVDWKIREGYLGKVPFPATMGIDFSGVIESVGEAVEDYHPGDAVLGIVSDDSGSYAEHCLAPVSQIARKPDSIDHITAAALPVASLAAWQALFDTAKLQPGQRVLIQAAAGGVGSFAVQFAKWKGAYVIGTASSRNIDYVRALGADEVIDYRTTKFENAVRDVDMVFDTIGGDTQDRSWQVLKRGGILVSIVSPPSGEKAAAHGVRAVFMVMQSRGDQLAQIAELVASGRVKVTIEKVFSLQETRLAQELSQSGHARGKIVLVVNSHA